MDFNDKDFLLPRLKERDEEKKVLEEIRELHRSIMREPEPEQNQDELFEEQSKAATIRVIRLGLDEVREQEIRHERMRLAAVEEDTGRQQEAVEGYARHELGVRATIIKERQRYEAQQRVLEERLNNYRLVQLKGSQNAMRKVSLFSSFSFAALKCSPSP